MGVSVLIDPRLFDEYLDDALKEYVTSLETAGGRARTQHKPRSWGLLFGRVEDDLVRIESLRFALNVRETDERVLEEFREVIVPCFGAGYTDKGRGFWCDSAEQLRLTREAQAQGLELVGSLHMHPDWQSIGPANERRQHVSEHPTEMDEYVYRNTGWPVNMICYLESRGEDITYTVAAWSAPPFDDPDRHPEPIPIRTKLAATPAARSW
ncbi:hypothetical protein [Actinophytocola sp.]|uniref:hypothetical protein n=1 Tax=Actinophytocola sp. TaxID=1872138 RepID=UPI003D6C4D5D